MKQEYSMQIAVESVIGDGDEREVYRCEMPARLTQNGGSYTLSFTEVREDTKLFTTLTFQPRGTRVHMKTRGGVKNEIVFDTTTPCVTRYEVAPLCFDLTVRSREISVSLDEHGGEIRLVYTRELAGDACPVVYRLAAVPREEADI